MTRDLARYPTKGTITPEGKPIFDAFNSEFQAMGWNVTPSSKIEMPDEEMQRGNIRVFTQDLGNRRTLIQLNTPYYDVHQLFDLNRRTGECIELCNPSIHEKQL